MNLFSSKACACLGIFGQFLITPFDHYACPIHVTVYFIDFYTNKRVQTHPFDLLSHRRKPIKMVRLVREINGHDVRLILVGASKPPETDSGKDVGRFMSTHLTYKHSPPFRIAFDCAHLFPKHDPTRREEMSHEPPLAAIS